MRRWLTFALGVIVSAFFAWLGFRGLDFEKLFDILGEIGLIWLPPAVIVYFVGAYILTWRWHYLLEPIKDIHANRLFPVVIIGYMGNNIYPARIGELIRAYILKRNENVSYAPSLAVILVERIFDGLVLLTFVLIALLFVEFEEPLLQRIIQVAAPLFFGALVVFTLLAVRPQAARAVYTRVITAIIPQRFQEKLLDLVEKFLNGLVALRDPRLLVMTWFSSVGSWTVEASTYWVVLHAFDFRVNFWVLMLVMGLANLTTVLPSTPGYVGTFHGVVVLTLEAFNVAGETAGAYAIVMHMVLWLPVTLVGAVFLWRQGMGWADLDRASRYAEGKAAA